jgi:hypothetical protein
MVKKLTFWDVRECFVIQVSGFRFQVSGFRLQVSGCRLNLKLGT